MKKLAFYRLMLSVWHRLPLFILYVFVYIIATAALLNFVTMQLFINLDRAVRTPAYDDPTRMKELLFGLIQANSYIYVCIPAGSSHSHLHVLAWSFLTDGSAYACRTGQPDILYDYRVQPESGSGQPKRSAESMPKYGNRTKQRHICINLLERSSSPGKYNFLQSSVRCILIYMGTRSMLDTGPAFQYIPRQKAYNTGS